MNLCHVTVLSVLIAVGSSSCLWAENRSRITDLAEATEVNEKTPALVDKDDLKVEFIKHPWKGAKRTSFTLFVKSEHPIRSIHANCGIVDGEGKAIGRFLLERKKIDESDLRRYSNSFIESWQNSHEEYSAKYHVACLADEYIQDATIYLQVIYQGDSRKSFGKRLRFSDARSAPRKHTETSEPPSDSE